MGNSHTKISIIGENAGQIRFSAEKEHGKMMRFTSEETNLMCLYSSGTRLELMDNLTDMRGYLEADETELLGLTDRVLEKLRRMSDQEFSALDLYPDFMD